MSVPLLLAGITAVAFVVKLVVVAALSTGAYFLQRSLAKKPHGNTSQEDTGLSTVATQGAYVPLLIGRARIGAIVAWVGERRIQNAGSRPTLYSEAAWHLLCVGPAQKIHRIWSNGDLIYPYGAYTDPIDKDTSPSGTSFTIGVGEFTVIWGENDESVDAFLADEDRVGLSAGFPNVCSIVWTRLGLQTSPQWPQIEYDVEVVPLNDAISESLAFVGQEIDTGDYAGSNLAYVLYQIMFESYPHGIGLDLADFDWNAGAEGGGDPVLERQHEETPSGFADGTYNMSGDAAGTPGSIDAGTYALEHLAPEYSGGGVEWGTNWLVVWLQDGDDTGAIVNVKIFLKGPSAQEVLLYEQASFGTFYNGASPISGWTPPSGWDLNSFLGSQWHAVTELQETEIVIDETGVWELWVEYDTEFTNEPSNFVSVSANVSLVPAATAPSGSLYEFLELMDEEEQVATVYARNGDEAGVQINNLLLDAGAIMPAMCDGRLGIVPIRPVEDADVIQVDEDQVLPPAAEIETLHADRPIDRVIFSFADVERNFRESVIQIDEDGQSSRAGNVRGTVLPMPTVRDFLVGGKVAERRSQEEFGKGAAFDLTLGRGAHRLIPGRVISVPDVADGLRVLSVKPSDVSDATEVQCVPDYYGVVDTGYVHPQTTAGDYSVDPVAANLQETFLEVPEPFGELGEIQILPLRIRAGVQVVYQYIHFSSDGADYDQDPIGGSGLTSGGTLDEAIAAGDPYVIDQGPEFTLVGLADDVLDFIDDLSSDEDLWRAGEQLALINNELFFLKKVTAIGGSTYRLDGLIRARFDSQRESHGINDEVFLFRWEEIDTFLTPKAVPGEALYLKQQPVSAAAALGLGSVTATSKTLVGKGLVPMRPSGLRVSEPLLGVAGYETGDDVVFKWSYRPKDGKIAGAGLQPLGSPMGDGEQRGSFRLEFYTTGDSLVRTENLSALTYSYDNGDLQSDLGGEVDFYVLLYNVDGGLISPELRLDVEAL